MCYANGYSAAADERCRALALKSATLRHVRTLLLVLALGQPQLLEGAEGAQDGPPDPHAEPSLDWRRRECSDLFLVRL